MKTVGDAEVLILREQLVPLVRFSDFLGIMPTYADPDTGNMKSAEGANLADRRSPRHPMSTKCRTPAEQNMRKPGK